MNIFRLLNKRVNISWSVGKNKGSSWWSGMCCLLHLSTAITEQLNRKI